VTALAWQPSLLQEAGTQSDPVLPPADHIPLTRGAWIETFPSAVVEANRWFDQIAREAPWAAHRRPMYDKIVAEPRLTTQDWPDPPRIVRALGRAISDHYDLDLAAVSANLYRDGADSVAWHGDRVGRERQETVVAILSLGAPRRFLMRPTGAGRAVCFLPRSGDLLVMGGTCQRTWEHSVPKCVSAYPRISVMFRESY
jgi:alkylated DNA repair dioxygenase AlkB